MAHASPAVALFLALVWLDWTQPPAETSKTATQEKVDLFDAAARQDRISLTGPHLKGRKLYGLGVRPAKDGGFWINDLYRHSPAESAGIEVGDLIVKMNGESILGHKLKAFLENVDAREKVEFTIRPRRGPERTVHLTKADGSTFGPSIGASDILFETAVGEVAPDFEATTSDGKKIKLSDLRGKPVLINFTATWCQPCKLETPALAELYGKYKDQGFEIISVYLDEAGQDLAAYAKGLGATWPIHSDGKGWQDSVNLDYGVSGVPTNVLVGKDGKILEANLRGPSTLMESALKKALATPGPQ